MSETDSANYVEAAARRAGGRGACCPYRDSLVLDDRPLSIRLGGTHGHVRLDVTDSLCWVETLGACPRAVEDGVASGEIVELSA